MWAIDGGLKWNGLAINGQYFMRRLNDFEADGPLPLASDIRPRLELTAAFRRSQNLDALRTRVQGLRTVCRLESSTAAEPSGISCPPSGSG
jgi:hypothetical protein